MDLTVLEETRQIVSDNTHGGASLLLFALLKTLSAENGQYLYLLNKLKDMTPETRRLAYRLMELMAQGGNETGEWKTTVAEIEEMIRKG
ncbi:hypothetical protein TspCOW1_08660 [Thiohalobacter sp. COW1]|uniref:Uncharacterized protein n=1 Tax=Thiohalobacter thiocyanaticus TaxID=585455 RepID=A0A1Z4VRQ7_9GAMM|nr:MULTISPECIES: hypothetical protein [Thiohalobacter]BAZ94173.1 uncharacterized protein FOKN1_1787 [Thiohalobacter thiocyanaticus]BCO30763.1 hypothetical protein TspCOW1_08660 [Thiohalobacter sp. COW1]